MLISLCGCKYFTLDSGKLFVLDEATVAKDILIKQQDIKSWDILTTWIAVWLIWMMVRF